MASKTKKAEEAAAEEAAAPVAPVLPAVVEAEVARIKKYLAEQIWMQHNNAEYEAIIEALVEDLSA